MATLDQATSLNLAGQLVPASLDTPPQLGRTFESYPAGAQQEALRRRAYIDALAAQHPVRQTQDMLKELAQRVATRIGDVSPPSAISIYRWHKSFVTSGHDLRALIPKFHARGGGGQRLQAEQLVLLEKAVDQTFLSLQRKSISSTYEALLSSIAYENSQRADESLIAPPSYATVRRYIRSLPCYEVDLARYGREYTRKKYRHSSITPTTMYLLERVEIDHTPFNIFVIDEESMLVLGRPYITVIIDCHTRMILGFYLSFSPPSIEAVLRCLQHAIGNKDYVKERYPDIQHDWPCHGIPTTAVVDNGLEFHSQDLLRATFELGLNYQFCPPRTPWFKPMVERSLRTLAEQFAHQLPGTSFANWFDRYGYDPLKESIVTLSELVHALHIWIIDIYSQTYHRGLKQTPYAAWQRAAEIVTPRTIDPERLRLVLSKQAERVLGHAGIELHGLRYNCKDLLPWRKQLGDRIKVQVRFDPDNLGSIFALHPQTKEAMPVPCLTPDYAEGLQLHQHKLIQAALHKEGLASADPLSLARAKVRMQEVIGQLLQSRKLADRKRAARAKGAHSSKVMTTGKRPPAISEDAELPPTDSWSPPSTLPVLTHAPEGDGHE
ncbi:Mu transposase C-terminal domain-containing protein [Chromobacterium piscinae]|uniref:Mu transposase C-terminal domain-containing protein n=1 Tax=Chromobacterium piscinae TaxID=686831 RepID=UPI001E408C63|nr:Mu transposase C-terminal domain-containing protein [Chromobacterium piscinae]MCD5326664.1 DDE-type integrase/transposase/recombinase [Chromobacterium piscinae]